MQCMRLRYGWLLVVLFAASSEGQVTWRRTYGGTGSDVARSVEQTADGGYLVAGSTGSFGNGAGDMYVVRTDALGEPLWTHVYGGIGVEQGVACRELADGYVLAGSTSLGVHGGYDMVLVRTDVNGEPLWTKNYGTAEWDLCYALDVLPDGFILGGLSYGAGQPSGSAYAVRTDLNGDTIWTQAFGGPLGTECAGIRATSDGGFIVVGSMATANGLTDGFFTKLDSDGYEAWTTPIGGDSADYLVDVHEAPNGEFVGSGGTHSHSDFMQILLANVLPAGQWNWERYFGSGADAGATAICADHDGGFVITGYNTLNLGARDIILTTTYPNGDFQFGNNYGDGEPADGYAINTTSDGGYVVAGWAENYGPGLRAMYVVKTDTAGQTASLDVDVFSDPLPVLSQEELQKIVLYPDPVASLSPVTVHGLPPGHTWEVRMSDMNGRAVFSTSMRSDNSLFVLPAMATGLYSVLLRAAGIEHRLRLCVAAQP